MKVSIDTFTCFPQGYDAVESDKSYTMMTDFARRIFKTSYGITVEGANMLLESGLDLSMSCACYCSRQNLIGLVTTQLGRVVRMSVWWRFGAIGMRSLP